MVYRNRIKSVLAKAIAQVLNKIEFEDSLVTLKDIELSGDERLLRVYIIVRPDKNKQQVIKKLYRIKREIRQDLAGMVALKKVPKLSFYTKESVDDEQDIYFSELEKRFKEIQSG